MKVGDLVRSYDGHIGIVEKVDKDYYGARQAFKIYKSLERGKCIRGNMVDGFGPTKDGISDRVLVLWGHAFATYEKSNTLEVITNE
jgi:hypothetical protein